VGSMWGHGGVPFEVGRAKGCGRQLAQCLASAVSK
jgi:hypothetical protein